MSFTVGNLRDDLERKLHGTTLDKLTDPDGLINEAARNVLTKIDPPETIRIQNITNGVFSDVTRYLLPSDIKGDRIVSIRPQNESKTQYDSRNVYEQEFRTHPRLHHWRVEHDSGDKFLRIRETGEVSVVIHAMDNLTNNGSWVASSDASNLTIDTYNYHYGSGALRFDLASSGSSGVLTNSSMTIVDLTDYQYDGAIMARINLPDGSDFTSVALRIGNDASNYLTVTATTAHDGTAFRDGWQWVRFPLASATETGTVSYTAIDYSVFTFAYNGDAQTSVRVDQLIAVLGTLYEIEYYSAYLFQDASTGAWIEKTSDDPTDVINASAGLYNLLLYETAALAAQEIQGEDSNFDTSFFEKRRKEAWQDYTKNNKSEAKPKTNRYYRSLKR